MNTKKIEFSDIVDASQRISEYIHRTPVLTCHELDRKVGARIYLKCENLQKAGAFKIRGACNATLSLKLSGYNGSLATHSSGNHGAALALAARQQGMKAHIVMPKNSNKAKYDAIIHYGGTVTFCGPLLTDRDHTLADVVETTNAKIIHPFDNLHVIAGQGTTALELIEDVAILDVLMAPIGGGGLLSGCALAARTLKPDIQIIGVEPAGAQVANLSRAAGKLVESPTPQTIADGLRAGIARTTHEVIENHVDDLATVDDAEIIYAMRWIWERTKLIIEPSSAVPIAALMGGHIVPKGSHIGVIVTGGNVDFDQLPW